MHKYILILSKGPLLFTDSDAKRAIIKTLDNFQARAQAGTVHVLFN